MSVLYCARVADTDVADAAESMEKVCLAERQSWAEITSLMLTALNAQQRTMLVSERERVEMQIEQWRQRNVELTKARELTEQQYNERIVEMEMEQKRLLEEFDALSKRMEVMAGHTGRLAEEKTTYSAQLTNAQNVIRRLNKLIVDLGQGRALDFEDQKLLQTVCKHSRDLNMTSIQKAVEKWTTPTTLNPPPPPLTKRTEGGTVTIKPAVGRRLPPPPPPPPLVDDDECSSKGSKRPPLDEDLEVVVDPATPVVTMAETASRSKRAKVEPKGDQRKGSTATLVEGRKQSDGRKMITKNETTKENQPPRRTRPKRAAASKRV